MARRERCSASHDLAVHGTPMKDGSVRCRVCLAEQARVMRAAQRAARDAARRAPKREPRPLRWIAALTPVQLAEARRELAVALAPKPGGRPKGNRLKRDHGAT